MPSIFDKNLLPEFDSVKDDDEEILWIAKPRFFPYTMTGMGMGVFVLLVVIFQSKILGNARVVGNFGGSSIDTFITASFIIFSTWQILKRLLSFNNTRYAFTNKRIMMRLGFWN